MENKANTTSENLDEEELEYEDSFSFCILSMIGNKGSSVQHSPTKSSDIIFCGRIIQEASDELNEYQKRDYLAVVHSESFRRLRSEGGYEISDVSITKDRSTSLSGKHSRNYQIQKVNITSLTSMSAKSRRWMFMFGPVKFKPEMELSAIKERQGRRVHTPMYPAPAGHEKRVMSEGASGKHRGKSSRWGTTVLAKSLGCLRQGQERRNGPETE